MKLNSETFLEKKLERKMVTKADLLKMLIFLKKTLRFEFFSRNIHKKTILNFNYQNY